jgi:hypothetical protein
MVTTEATGAEASGTKASKARSKGGVPRVPLATAESYARAVWDTAKRNEAAPVAVARTITGKADAKAEGGAWRTKVAALRAFHLVEKVKSDNLKLSDLGLAVVNASDPQAQLEGRRQAIFGVEAYRKILDGMGGHPLPAAPALSGIFEFEYELPAVAGVEATTVLIESLKHAQMLTPDGIFQVDAGVAAPPAFDIADVPERNPSLEAPEGELGQQREVQQEQRADPPAPLNGAQSVVAAAASVNVTIDMSQWSIGDVLSVLRALGYDAGEAE